MKILNEMTGQEMFFLLAGPCVIEGEEMALKIAEHVSELTDKWGIPYVFKGSFKKANRSRLDSFTGIGDEKALKILAKIRKDFQIPVVTDIIVLKMPLWLPSMLISFKSRHFSADRPIYW